MYTEEQFNQLVRLVENHKACYRIDGGWSCDSCIVWKACNDLEDIVEKAKELLVELLP